MLELVIINRAPAAIVNVRTEPILASGSIVCKHFYNKEIPIICLDEKSFHMLQTGQNVTVDATRNVIIMDDQS